jgi:hypothetical protein
MAGREEESTRIGTRIGTLKIEKWKSESIFDFGNQSNYPYLFLPIGQLSHILQVIGPLLDLIATLSFSKHYQLVVEQTPQVFHIFINLIMHAAIPENNWNIHLVVRLLRIFHNTIPQLKDKSNARTQPIFNALMYFLKAPNMNIQFFSLGILLVLIHRQEQWKVRKYLNNHKMIFYLRKLSLNKMALKLF